jgi:hypothetical protein
MGYRFYILGAMFFAMSAPLYANDLDSEESSRLKLDDAPYVTGRAPGMANALSTLADGADAPYYNPAGIGGYNDGKTSRNFIRQFHFPYAGIAANENSTKLYNEYKKSDASTNSKAVTTILDHGADKRQYARFSLFPNVVTGRIIFGPIVDHQVAAVPVGGSSDLIHAHYAQTSGFGVGTSMSDNKGTISLGVFAAMMNRKDTEGEFDFQRVINKDERQAELGANSVNSSGRAINAGVNWRISDKHNTRLALVARNLGDTKYVISGDDHFLVKQDLTIGFSVSPKLGKWGIWNLILEGGRLSDENTAVNKKIRIGTELLVGVSKGPPLLGIRAGYNLAGVSYGAHLDIGLVGFQFASSAEDVGIDNDHVVERRNIAIMSINVAEY